MQKKVRRFLKNLPRFRKNVGDFFEPLARFYTTDVNEGTMS